ncbi:hypothetical protein [Acidithiobacillus caldus]|uniref:Uncharacterized protein n=2 Tax=Acidithiobacillus caldus TaxID=33059 RepID=A0A059ZM15_ACICK|nr:hypothetical protein [Acidithiobacillus caldus]AIA54104.1 hypothetical protein Acaty_c0213 [Acidithiobacillus caldus ATCC 51756]AIA56689.1 hypothetical protein Acaty_m0116 [Acidithiobacillus caldus ATCC 51756]OFC36577.1 hypothetical protein BAE27_06025 [Acidithiobacillus caldus]OFC39922.1 hypothetical protein BAE28_02015 [Acidithiobacillus caldus]OFC41876.1 hypothetical protein BAE29_01610 [Acidithiobacillus caldus]
MHWDLWFIPLSNAEPPERKVRRIGAVYVIRLPDLVLPALQHLLETRMRESYLLCLCVSQIFRGCHPRDHAFIQSDWAIWS